MIEGEPIADESRDRLLQMDLARRIRPYVIGDAEKIAERVAAELVDDLAGIGFDLLIAWAPKDREP